MNKNSIQTSVCQPNQLRTLPAAIRKRLIAEAVALAAFSFIPVAHANPTGGQVAAGNAAIVEQGARMDINQSSQRAVINWQSFSIDTHEHVNFNQPGRDAATLNRVVGNDPSAILGRMTANGNVYLINQNGIMVGKDAQINVGSLTASTANISNEDFMAGNLHFAEPGNPEARIVNFGNITAQQGGLVALVAPGVENHGVINARLGKVALASGDAFTLDLYGDRLIQLTVSKEQLDHIPNAEGHPLSHYVSNTGEITADGGIVTIMAGTGKAIIDSLINLQGHVQAQSIENKNGVISLLGDDGTRIDVAGTLDASGRSAQNDGGKVEIRGREVNLQAGSRIDVSGDRQGGTALIGGDYQGSGDGVRALLTTVERSAAINADSKTAGDGGKVIVWADDRTVYDGSISTRGGSASGNGGLVEVSGKNTLHFDGEVDASAKNGSAGELLLDPGNLTIASKTQMQSTTLLPNTGTYSSPSSADNVISSEKVNYLLQTGTSVSLKTSNDLTVASQIDGRATNGVAGASFSLSAGNNININDNILTNNGDIFINAITGNITMANGTALFAGNRNITLTAGNHTDLQHLLSTGKIDVTSGADSIFRQALVGLNNQGIGVFEVDAGGNVGLNGLLTIGGVTVLADGSIDVFKPIFAGGAVDLSGGALNVANGADISTKGANGALPGNELKLTSIGDMQVNANLLTDNAKIILKTTGTEGSITTADKILIDPGSEKLTIDAGKNITMGKTCLAPGGLCNHSTIENQGAIPATATLISQNGDIKLGDIIADRGLSITANQGKLDLSTIDLRSRGSAGIELTAKNALNLKGDLLTENGTLKIIDSGSVTGTSDKRLETGTADISLRSAGAVSLYDVFTTGKLDVIADGPIIFNRALGTGDNTYTGLAALSVQGKDAITFNDQVHLTGNHPAEGNYPTSDNVLSVLQTGTTGKLTINGKIVVDNGSVYLGKPVGIDYFNDANNIELGNSIYTLNGDAITLNNDIHVYNSKKIDSLLNVDIPPSFSEYPLHYVKDVDNQPTVELENQNGNILLSGNINGLFEPNLLLNLKLYAKSISLPNWVGIPAESFTIDSKTFNVWDGDDLSVYVNRDIENLLFFYIRTLGTAAFDYSEKPRDQNEKIPQKPISQATPILSQNRNSSWDTFNMLGNNAVSTSTASPQNSFNTDFRLFGAPSNSVSSDPEGIDTSSITKQTLNYADSSETTPNANAPENSDEETVILGGGSEADNADLGLNSPENGAVQDTYSTKHSPVCGVGRGNSKNGLPQCKEAS
ncbi:MULTISPECIES: filamentous hemagglutinin N-terminal domain-containing protein [Methylomicrobium]|uniref:Filamentous hemagglutinin family N-terminal domain protein n=1 Tax=Methylomicrobium album BG8 TaxID=686340 RepID=H8GHW9_METAL|nr:MULTISPECIES: filamentous hemagglutinin N-terminal domain-containing protein [Methylomicrobium]EIC28953.1 filamentous hemagglutinin family N-terminal domain protein [Methylomicrobium album BG8]